MLSHLEQHVAATLATAHMATLATTGPAGLQAHVFRCVAQGARLYLLLPQTSDHLLNLESDPTVAVTTQAWQLHGHGRILSRVALYGFPALAADPAAPWSVVVEVVPHQFQVAHVRGWGASETFDLD